MHKNYIYLAIVIVALIGLGTGIAYGLYLMTSNPVGITVNSQYGLTLAANVTTITVGDSVHLTATCNDTSFTGTVNFLANGDSIANVTASGGVASYDWTPSIGSYSVVAEASHP